MYFIWKIYLFICTCDWCNIICVQKITCILKVNGVIGGIRLHFANVLCRKREYRWNERNPLKSIKKGLKERNLTFTGKRLLEQHGMSVARFIELYGKV